MRRHRLATPETVLSQLALLRSQDAVRGHRRSPETPDQRGFVLDWHK
jgi:hypothetical protein